MITALLIISFILSVAGYREVFVGMRDPSGKRPGVLLLISLLPIVNIVIAAVLIIKHYSHKFVTFMRSAVYMGDIDKL